MRLVTPVIALLLLACLWLACWHSRPPITLGDKEVTARPLRLDWGELGSTAGWNWRDGWGGDEFKFVARETASYLFSVSPHYETASESRYIPQIEIYTHDPKLGFRTVGTTSQLLTVPLNPGVYYVNVDGNRVDRGPYKLDVTIDTRHEAAIRAEDPNVVEPLCARAPALGEAPALGTFQSRSGGARASCGGTGGEAIYVLETTRPGRVTLQAVAHFKIALELRPNCMGGPAAPLGCAKADGYDATLSAPVGPGRYFVVIDAAEAGALGMGIPDAGVRGAFSLEARVERAP
jgi:hypothetical protein